MDPRTLGLAVKVGLRALPLDQRQALAADMAAPLSVLDSHQNYGRTTITVTSGEREILDLLATAVRRASGRHVSTSALIHAALFHFTRCLALAPGGICSSKVVDLLEVGDV